MSITLYTAAWLYNPGQKPLANAGLLVKDGLVHQVGKASELISQYGPSTADYPDCVLMPGFVNAHTHLELTDFPIWQARLGNIPSGMDFTGWIMEVIRVKQNISQADLTTSILNGIRQSLAAGTALVGDIVSQPDLLSAFSTYKGRIGGRIYAELIGHSHQIFLPRLEAAVSGLATLPDGLKQGLSPHAPYTLNQAVLPDIAKAAWSNKLPLSIHIGESPAELELLAAGSGPLAEQLYPLVGWQQYLQPDRGTDPVQFFDQAGLLGADTLAVHCVQLTEKGAAVLKQRGVTVCLCPRSNQQLDVGVAPVRLFKEMGLPLCLGTDSLASNVSLSLWDECRFAMDCYNGELAPEELLQMATAGGAAGIRMAGQAGSLEPGKLAAFQVVELAGSCTAERLLEQGKVMGVV